MDLPVEMYKKYIERRKQDVTLLKDAVATGGLDVFKRIGHQIRGNAASFGFTDLAQLGGRMEDLDSVKLAAEGQDILKAFSQWIEVKEKEFSNL